MTVGSQDTVTPGGTIEVDATWAADAITINAYTGQAVSIGGLNRTYDIFIGDASINTVLGTQNDDALIYDTTNEAEFPTAAHFNSIEQFDLGPGSDVLNLTSGLAGVTSYAVSIGVVQARSGQDTIWTGSGNDLVVGDFNVTTGGLFDASADKLHSGAGNDRLFGDGRSVGRDVALANDWIDGGTGNDILFGDGETWGTDFTGTRGNNIFAFDGPGSGQDQIGTGVSNGFANGFQIGRDTILLDPSYGFTVAQVLTRIANNVNGDAVIDLGNSDTITLVGVSVASLTAADFVVQSVTAVAAPSGADKTVTINEDSSYTFSAADFGFSDPNEFIANAFTKVIISQLPANGTLSLNNIAVTAGQSIGVASIPSLVFTPVLNGNGIGYAFFTFQVQDDGLASINGGQNIDASANSFTFDVTPVNDAPTGIAIANTVTAIAENTSTATRIKVADISVSDVDAGTNTLSLTGADASFFEILGSALYLKAGTLIDFESKGTFSVTINADDASVGSTPDASKAFTLNVTDVNEAPTAVNFANVLGSIAENASTAARRKVADITVTDDALGTETITLTGADASKFEIFDGDLYLKAGATLDFETNPKLDVTVNVDDTTLGSGIELSRALSVTVIDVLETISGSSGSNTLTGTSGADRINAGSGNDSVNGGAGDDIIYGGAGVDKLTGGTGRDTFVFKNITESGYRASGSLTEGGPLTDQAAIGQRDIITDFTPGFDKIDLSDIDANTSLSGNQAFTFRGTGGLSSAGSLVYRKFDNAGTASDRTIIFADTNGDGRSDFQIELTGLKTLAAGEFVL